jgi:hypothetical protein
MSAIQFRLPQKQCLHQDIPIHINLIRRFADAHDIYAGSWSHQISTNLRAAADRLESAFGVAVVQLGESEEDRLAGLLIDLCMDMAMHNQTFKDIVHRPLKHSWRRRRRRRRREGYCEWSVDFNLCFTYAYFVLPVPASLAHVEVNLMAIRQTPVQPFDYGAIDGSQNLLAQYEKVKGNVGGAVANSSFAEGVNLQDWFRDKGKRLLQDKAY